MRFLAFLILLLAVPDPFLLALPPVDMVRIPGGTFWMGSDEGLDRERPTHPVTLDRFWIDKYPVTNLKYLEFVQRTGFVTFSERDPDPKDFPGVPKDKLVAGSAIFQSPKHKVDMR